jgi:3D (Asp-Asp-Asp) domain-containing protein
MDYKGLTTILLLLAVLLMASTREYGYSGPETHASIIESRMPEVIDTTAAPEVTDTAAAPQATREYLGEFTVYAYCHCKKCTGSGNGITASGARVREGRTVAADIKILPMGSQIYIDGVGLRTVEDTGGAIKGNKLDVYHLTHQEALDFGVKKLKVWKEI